MHQKLLDRIKDCSKDEAAYAELKEIFQEISEKADRYETYLNLLERAISNDYDSILITELELEEPGPKIVYVNDGFTKMTGYSREEVIGKTPRILQGPKTDQAVLEKLKNRLKEGKSFFGHTVNYRKDGTEFVNQWDIHPLTDEDGNVTHWVSYQHDITERKRSEKKLVDAKVEFDNLMEESKSTLVDVDEQGNILSANKSFRDMTGYDADELKKVKFWDLVTDKYVEKFRHRFDTFKASDFDARSYELKIKTKNGDEIEALVRTRLLANNGQKIVRMTIENRSLQKRIMKILQNRSKGFKKVFDKKTEFRYRLVPEGADYRFDTISESFSMITGLAVAEISGKSLSEIIHEDDLEKALAHYEKVKEGSSSTEVLRIKTRSGEYISVMDYAKPIEDEDGNVEAIKGCCTLEISSEQKV